MRLAEKLDWKGLMTDILHGPHGNMFLVADHSTDIATSPVCEYMHAFWKCYMLKSSPDVTAYQPFWQRKGQGICHFLFSLMIFPSIRANSFVTNTEYLFYCFM